MKGAKEPEKWFPNDDVNHDVNVHTKKLKNLDPDFVEPSTKQKSYFE
jgi:hypothetical protein